MILENIMNFKKYFQLENIVENKMNISDDCDNYTGK